MLRRVLALLALPVASLVAQATDVEVRVTAPATVAFRLVNVARDTAANAKGPIVARGEVLYRYSAADTGQFAVAALDSVSRIHIEARENGQLIGIAEGPYVAVLRDSTGRVMVAARSSIPRDPFSFQIRRP